MVFLSTDKEEALVAERIEERVSEPDDAWPESPLMVPRFLEELPLVLQDIAMKQTNQNNAGLTCIFGMFKEPLSRAEEIITELFLETIGKPKSC